MSATNEKKVMLESKEPEETKDKPQREDSERTADYPYDDYDAYDDFACDTVGAKGKSKNDGGGNVYSSKHTRIRAARQAPSKPPKSSK